VISSMQVRQEACISQRNLTEYTGDLIPESAVANASLKLSRPMRQVSIG